MLFGALTTEGTKRFWRETFLRSTRGVIFHPSNQSARSANVYIGPVIYFQQIFELYAPYKAEGTSRSGGSEHLRTLIGSGSDEVGKQVID